MDEFNDPLFHLSDFQDPERKQRVEEILDDIICHCHGCWPKVVGLQAVEIDNLRTENQRHIASVNRIADREIELCDRVDELQEWLANILDLYDVKYHFATHDNVERTFALKQKLGSEEAIREKGWDVCNNS